jgi:hypothetical protein
MKTDCDKAIQAKEMLDFEVLEIPFKNASGVTAMN